MSTLVPDEISMEDPLCDSSFGSMVTLDYVTPVTARMGSEILALVRDAATHCHSAQSLGAPRWTGQIQLPQGG